jgi:sigma-B regulation protein RsbU (phosphoserine phosphatase)
VTPEAAYVSGRLRLQPGETVLVFTDGVTEAANLKEELFSEERLEAALREAGGCGSAALIRSATQAVRDFVAGALPSDDITMLAVRWLGTAPD